MGTAGISSSSATAGSNILSGLGNRALFAAILLFGLLAMTARPATDPDLWWHLRTGQWIVQTEHIPRTDPFSFTRQGQPWVSHEWLSDAILFGLWKHGGPGALIIFSSIVTSAGFLILYWRCPGEPYIAAALVSLGAWASAPCWGTRPQMFTFLLASLFLWLLEQADHRPVLLFWIPPLFLLWLNLHAGFALGPALVIFYAAGLLCEAAAGTTPWSDVRPAVVRLTVVAFICLALVPLNPSGFQLYRYPLDTLRSPGMRSFIVEWFSPDFHQWLYTPLLLVILLLLVGCAWSRSPLKARFLFPLIVLCLAALDAVRHIPVFMLVAIPVLASVLAYSRISLSPSSRPRNHRLRRAFNLAAVALIAVFCFVRWTTLARNEDAKVASQFPQSAVNFLRDSRQPPRLFAYYDWGGYAIWNLYPQYRVFVDGRADLYGDKFLEQSVQTVTHLEKGWRTILDDWNVDTVLLPPTAALAQGLALDDQWHTAYKDTQSVIFVRHATNAPNLP